MRNFIASILRRQAKRLLKRVNPKVVVVSGSVGKTSTTQAISTILSQQFIVRGTVANYNTNIGVPCSIFGRKLPSHLANPLAWLWMMIKNELAILKKAHFDILVQEIGTDKPGEISQFAWLNPDIAIVTAVAPEHMEFFGDLEAVAKEELAVAEYSKKVIINKKMVASVHLKFVEASEIFNYSREDIEHIGLDKKDLKVVGEHSIDAISAGMAVGKEFGMSTTNMQAGAKTVRPQKGRMNLLNGIMDSTLIDDTYNASPEAVAAALDYLYSIKNVQRIALIGNMNELGAVSADEHKKIGAYCDPTKLDLIVTLGPDANNYILSEAKAKGCNVVASMTPYEAAEIIKENLKTGAYVLFKGSQNKVFAEEAVKLLLENPEDEKFLVRQSKFWQKIKKNCFKDV